MLDFLVIATRSGKRGIIEIYPKFIIKKSSDLMIRGGDFYAIWIEERGLWSTDEQDAVDLIDRELDRYAEENCKRFDDNYRVMHMWDAETGMIDTWHKYCQKQMKDQFHMLDEKLIFSNSKTGKKDYASKMLNYPLEQGEANSYDKLMSVLYSPAERHKIEWAIGSVVSGDSKRLQKFMVLYGAAGTGKSTVLNIIQQLFDGYYSVFDAKALGSSSNARVKAKVQANNITDKDEISKIRRAAISDARNSTGASGKRTRITISDGEWTAIQSGAISDTTLSEILRYAEPKTVRERATPRRTTQLSDARISRIKAMANSGHTNAEIAEALGISTSAVSKYLNS